MGKNIIRTIILIILIVFSCVVGSKIITLNKEHEGKIRIVYDIEDSGYKETWVEKGSIVPLENLSAPSDTYTFSGWTDRKTEKFVYGPLIANENMILEENYYYSDTTNLTWMTVVFDNGQPNISYAYQFGNTVLLPMDPVKEGFKFNGWIDTATGLPVNEGDSKVSLVIQATWVQE